MFSTFWRNTGMLRDGWRLKPQLVETHKRSSPTTRAQSPTRSRIFLTGSIQWHASSTIPAAIFDAAVVLDERARSAYVEDACGLHHHFSQ